MNKQEFISSLRSELSAFPSQEVEERLSFYSEMIDDRMEEGLSEEDAVAGVGSVDKIAAQIAEEISQDNTNAEPEESEKPKAEENPQGKADNADQKAKQDDIDWRSVWAKVRPVLKTCLSVFFAIMVFAVYAAIVSVAFALWTAVFALGASSIGCLFLAIVSAFIPNAASAFALIGISLICAGLSIIGFIFLKRVTVDVFTFTKKAVKSIGNSLKAKEGKDHE